jgi:fimbrial chaperone protein
MRNFFGLGILISLLALSSMPVLANESSNMTIQPMKIEVPADSQTASVTLTNNSGADKLYQATIYSWSQVNGKDELVPTNEVIVFPPVIPMPAGVTKVVRLGIKPVAAPGTHERSYRLIVAEVPRQVNNVNGVQFAYRFSLPIFIAPVGKITPDVSWTATLNPNHRQVSLTLNNDGAGYVLPHNLKLYSDFAGTEMIGQTNVGTDILSGAKKTFEFTLAQPLNGKAITGEVELDGGKVLKFSVPIS